MKFSITLNGQDQDIELDPIEQHAVLSVLWDISRSSVQPKFRKDTFDKAHRLVAALFNGSVGQIHQGRS